MPHAAITPRWLIALCTALIFGLSGVGCRSLNFDLAPGVSKSHDRVLVSGQVNYRCLVPRHADAGVLVQLEDEDGRAIAQTLTGSDGRFVLTSPLGLSTSAKVFLVAGDLRSRGVPGRRRHRGGQPPSPAALGPPVGQLAGQGRAGDVAWGGRPLPALAHPERARPPPPPLKPRGCPCSLS